MVSITEQNEHSDFQVAKCGVAILQNAPVANYAEDFQTRLEVISKLVPQHEVQRAYGEFVKKLNEMCYESVAEQLVRSKHPASIVGTVYNQNMHSASLRNRRKSSKNNGYNSTMRRLYRAAEDVQKHLFTISESNNSEASLVPIKQINQRSTSKILHRDGTLRCKTSRKIVSAKRMKNHMKASIMIETEFNITKDSLRNSNIVIREQKDERTAAVRTNRKHPENESELILPEQDIRSIFVV